jgi:hypothetical protein
MLNHTHITVFFILIDKVFRKLTVFGIRDPRNRYIRDKTCKLFEFSFSNAVHLICWINNNDNPQTTRKNFYVIIRKQFPNSLQDKQFKNLFISKHIFT